MAGPKVKLRLTILYIEALGLVVLEKKFFLCISHYKPMADNDAPVAWPGALLAGFIKRTAIHCYTQNMKALGLVVLEKIFFMVFPL